MARFAGLDLEPILADSDDDDGDMAFRRAGWGGVPGGDDKRGKGNDALTDTWQNEVGNIKVNDRGMRVAQRDGQEELLLEGQVVPEQLAFVDGRVIGRGACSVVNLARHKDTGQLFAVKVFSLLDREKRRQLDREIGTLLRSLENGCCSQLVDFFGAFKRPDGSIRVVLEFMDRGSLADVMDYRAAIQSRWNERRAGEEQQKCKAAAKASAGADNATLLSSGRHGVSNGHARPREAFSGREDIRGSGGVQYYINDYDYNETLSDDTLGGRQGAYYDVDEEDDDDEEDDIPATFERLRDPRRRSSGGPSNKGSQHSGSSKKRDANLDRGYQNRNVGSSGGGGWGGSRRAGGGLELSLPDGDYDRQRLKGSASDPSRLVVDASPHPVGDRIKPAPLTQGALATPSSAPFETKLDRGRGKTEAPWVQLDDLRGGFVHESPAEAERQRAQDEAEAQRRKEQEEWDRAFEEELMQTGLPEDVVAACVYQILKGLTYLHEHNQLHRDVKPSNILLNARGEVKLTDFGIARELDHAGAMVETVVGTVRYMSPERLHGEAYGRPADVWGLGLVMIECVTQEAPYADGCSQIEILQTLKEHGGNGLLPSGVENRAPLSDAFVRFVSDCLKVKPEDRLTTSELLDSQWFIEQGVHGREEAVELMAEYLEGLYGPHAFKYFEDVGDGSNNASDSGGSGLFP